MEEVASQHSLVDRYTRQRKVFQIVKKYQQKHGVERKPGVTEMGPSPGWLEHECVEGCWGNKYGARGAAQEL